MMITEHNFEEYFLLYIDNELAFAEQKDVEDFINKHPQYLPLLNALQETKLSTDESVSFFNKEDLFKDESTDIGIGNYQEYFLLYTDNELSREQKETTERFVLQHPQLQEEFTLLQQTKLAPEVIEYKNKPELYKRDRRVLPLYIAGLSAAAVIFAVMFFTGLFTPKQYKDNSIAAASIKHENNILPQPVQEIPVHDNNMVSHLPEENKKVLLADGTLKINKGKNKVITTPEKNTGTEPASEIALLNHPKEEIVITHQHEEVQLPLVSSPDKAIARQVSVLKPLEDIDNEQTNATETLSLTDNNMARTAVYKELDTEDDNHTLYLSGIQLNKNKVNGFLKSASKLLGGKSRQNVE